ncbi:hypothetical protein MKS88_002276 [Plasmodium brasilianum]|uniref:Uncharacterized protein n=2 Tax=Plasmodium (Plasmodium) TaxID=418103 RepID=A0A1A8WWL4_PLAMA|nr:conserved Plasmodium protein, unknown function [Plasmodium malariae]KAI4838769.1 hypothetical protein MKS88_002276 [Plasmodium brasilianum]SBS96282.1 conserved Plasmodium protein, unknown function [Plasmodium malariae]SCN12107.1 conserved Plasmodium protein, unknown function [Plasmodium malariae]
MNFIKTYIYEQEYTNDGIKELEKDARSSKEIDENKILKELPEFKRDNQFLSLSEQLNLKNNNNIPVKVDEDYGGDHGNVYGIPNITEEYFEYYENYAKNDRYSAEKIKEREKEVQHEFKEAIKSYVQKRGLKEDETTSNILREENNINLREIKKSIINKKKTIPAKLSVKAIIKTKKKKECLNSEGKPSHLKELVQNQTSKTQVQENSLLVGYSDNSDS